MNSSSKKQLNWNITTQLSQEKLEQLINSEEKVIDDNLWEKRPIRLLNVKGEISWKKFKDSELYDKEYNRITSSLKANYYNIEYLKSIFSKDKDGLNSLEKPQEISNGVFFPTVNEKEESYLPISSITSFCKIDEKKFDFKRDILPNQNKLNKLLDFETKFFPEIIQFEEIKGDSFEVAWFVQEWLYFYNSTFHEKKSIFCTGTIDNEGNICKIDYPNEKLDTALYFKFTYIVFPEGNRKDLESSKGIKVLFFSNINQLKSWLLEMSENLSELNIIPRWLSSNMETPKSDIFKEYFNHSIKGNPINGWKQKIQSISLEQKLNKLRTLANKYADYICKTSKQNIYLHYPAFLPLDFFYFSLLDYFSFEKNDIKDNKKESLLRDLEKLYYSLFDKLLSNDNNINLASLRLQSLKQDRTNIFSIVLKKYPAIIGLFFNHPTDYLLLIASLSEESRKLSKNIISIIINALNSFNKNNNKSDLETQILKLIINNYSKEIKSIKPSIKKTSDQMATLVQAKILALKHNRKDLIIVCNNYFKFIVKNLENKIYSSSLLESFSLIEKIAKLEKWLIENRSNLDILKTEGYSKYIEELTKYSNTIKKENEKNVDGDDYKSLISKSLKNSIELIKVLISEKENNQNKTTDFYPQPALYLFLFIRNNISKNYLKVLNEFSKSYKGNSFKLKTYCLSYWSGCLAAKLNYKFSYNNEDEYKLSFLLGYLNISKNKEIYKYLKKEIGKLLSNINDINSLPLLQLIWIKFFNSEIIENLDFKEIITSINNYLRNFEENNTTAAFIKKLLYPPQKETKIINNPQRSIQQLLNQLVKLLIYNDYNDSIVDECGLNNSQFITEFIRIFCIKNNTPESLLFIPIHWRTSIDKQMFNTIAISYFYTNKNKYLLQNYLFSVVDDLPNLLLGFQLLDSM